MHKIMTIKDLLEINPKQHGISESILGLQTLARELLAIKKELKEIKEKTVTEKIVVLREVQYHEAKKMVEEYLQTHDSAYMYEISNDLGLDLRIVHQIAEELQKEGKIE